MHLSWPAVVVGLQDHRTEMRSVAKHTPYTDSQAKKKIILLPFAPYENGEHTKKDSTTRIYKTTLWSGPTNDTSQSRQTISKPATNGHETSQINAMPNQQMRIAQVMCIWPYIEGEMIIVPSIVD